MSEVMTPAAVVADVRSPIDGEPASAATLRSETLQTLLDRTRYLIDLLSGTLAAATGIVVRGLQVNGSANVGDVETPRAFNVWGDSNFIGSLLSTGTSFFRGNTTIGAVDGTSTTTLGGYRMETSHILTSLSGDGSISGGGAFVVILNPNGANRVVNLTTDAGSVNDWCHYVIHGGTANTLTLRDDFSSTDLIVLQPGQARFIIRHAGRWY